MRPKYMHTRYRGIIETRPGNEELMRRVRVGPNLPVLLPVYFASGSALALPEYTNE